MKLIKKKKGFTLVEILITITILFIVIGIVFPLFNANLKTLSETENRSDLQREGQQAMKYFTDKAMEAQKIVGLKDSSNNVKLDSSSTSIGEIEFTAPDSDITTNSTINYYFMIKDNSLYYQQKSPVIAVDHSKDRRIADNIQSIEVQAINGKNFSEGKGLN
ncbi:MAG: prepilin-type N-terminal cleavage/methylation domain-containing protein, partial [Clostridiaceae bacterium]|nr:prepilin-type N-terminal cleavage/methylation domain-containing protein [Clostridiaceae bacterium]